MDAFTGPGVAFRIEHLLHFLEEFGLNERLVSAGILDAVVGDVAEIVPVAQHGAEAVNGDRSGAVAAVTFGAQAGVGECVAQFAEPVVPARVEFESHSDERGAFGVDVDRADLSALIVDADVLVADLRHAERAAIFGFLAHLVFDVFTGYQDLVFVEDGDHAVHGASGGAFVEVLFRGRDECHAEPLERHHHDRIVVPVAGEAGQRVDDDVANVGVGLEVGDHLPEGVAVLDRLRGLAGVGELVDDDGAEFFRARGDGLTLGGQRDAFGIEIRLDLAE